jgi:hypothetical protein
MKISELEVGAAYKADPVTYILLIKEKSGFVGVFNFAYEDKWEAMRFSKEDWTRSDFSDKSELIGIDGREALGITNRDIMKAILQEWQK